jgi:hypothetical protein
MKEVEFIFQRLRRNLNLIFVMADKKFSPEYQDFSLWSVKWTYANGNPVATRKWFGSCRR